MFESGREPQERKVTCQHAFMCSRRNYSSRSKGKGGGKNGVVQQIDVVVVIDAMEVIDVIDLAEWGLMREGRVYDF